MIIYEVNLDVDADVADAVAAWLPGHIQELLALDGFVSATWYDRDGDAPDQVLWTVQYVLRDYAALSDYLEVHAPRLRQDGVDRLGGRFTATRRILATREVFEG